MGNLGAHWGGKWEKEWYTGVASGDRRAHWGGKWEIEGHTWVVSWRWMGHTGVVSGDRRHMEGHTGGWSEVLKY